MNILISCRFSFLFCLSFLMTDSSSSHYFWIKGEPVILYPLFLPFHRAFQRVIFRIAEEICVEEVDQQGIIVGNSWLVKAIVILQKHISMMNFPIWKAFEIVDRAYLENFKPERLAWLILLIVFLFWNFEIYKRVKKKANVITESKQQPVVTEKKKNDLIQAIFRATPCKTIKKFKFLFHFGSYITTKT